MQFTPRIVSLPVKPLLAVNRRRSNRYLRATWRLRVASYGLVAVVDTRMVTSMQALPLLSLLHFFDGKTVRQDEAGNENIQKQARTVLFSLYLLYLKIKLTRTKFHRVF